MKMLFLILVIMILFVGCNTINDTTNNSVTITTDRSMYTPAMSSAQGITMTPNFKTDKKYKIPPAHIRSMKGNLKKELWI